MKSFNMICAVAMNGVIGDSATNSIPWYLPGDLKKFKEITTGKVVVMGSRTFNSLPFKLPNRENVVITRGATNLDYTPDRTHYSFTNAHSWEQPGFFVIGGEHIFREALHLGPERLYLTIVKIDAEGDVRFPISGHTLVYDKVVTSTGIEYACESRSEWMKENGIEYQFVVFKRV